MSEQENTNTTYEKIGQMIAIRNSIKDVVNSKEGESISDDTPFDEYAGIITEKLSLKNELCKLTFSPNGGTGANFEYKNMIPNKSSVILPTYSGVKRGHTLSNSVWGKTPSSGQDTYAYNSPYDVVDNETFYAQWTKNKYNLSWDTVGMKNCGFTVDGESVNAPGTKEVEFEAGVELKCTPDEGYDFYKWDGNGIPPEGSKTSEKLKFQMPSNDVKELKPNVGIKKAVISYQLYARYYGLLDQFSEYKRKFDIYLGYSQEFDIDSEVPVSEDTGYGYIIFIPENCMISEFTAYTKTEDEGVVKTTLAYSDFVNIEDTGGQSLSEPFMTIGMVKDGSETPEYVRTVELGGENYRIYTYKGKETDKIISVECTVYFSVTNSEPYLYRTTAGSASVGSGNAEIRQIKGNSIVWNQLAYILSFTTSTDGGITYTNNNDGTQTLNGTCTAVRSNSETNRWIFPQINGHKYIKLQNGDISVPFTYATAGTGYNNNSSCIYTADNDSYPYFKLSGIVGNTYFNQKCWVMFFDLTKMFGAGNEPASVAEFKAMFPLDYYPYNEGEVISTNISSLKSVEFNLWDEEQLSNKYWEDDGTIKSFASNATFKTPIRVLPNMEYYINTTQTHTHKFWSKDMQLIEKDNNKTIITAPANAYYLTINFSGSVINPNTCVNYSWSGYRNGEYEPYNSHTISIPISSIKDSNNVQLFQDGLCKVGSVYDEITSTKAIKRVGKVDLGSLSWSYEISIFGSGTSGFIATLSNGKPASAGVIANILTNIYTAVTAGRQASNFENKTISFYNGFSQPKIIIQDSSYTDAATFTAAMNGVILYYELATPTEVVFAEPINLNYQVSDFGTEEIIPDDTITTNPKTAPFAHETMYWFDTYNNTHRTTE